MSTLRTDLFEIDDSLLDIDVERIPSLWPVDDRSGSSLGIVIDPVSGRLLLPGDESLGEPDQEVRLFR